MIRVGAGGALDGLGRTANRLGRPGPPLDGDCRPRGWHWIRAGCRWMRTDGRGAKLSLDQ